MISPFEKATKITNSTGCIVFGTYSVKATINGKKQSAILLLSDLGIDIREYPTGYLLQTGKWVLIQGICKVEKTIKLTFMENNNIVFDLSKASTSIISMIVDIVQRVLIPSEYNKLDLHSFLKEFQKTKEFKEFKKIKNIKEIKEIYYSYHNKINASCNNNENSKENIFETSGKMNKITESPEKVKENQENEEDEINYLKKFDLTVEPTSISILARMKMLSLCYINAVINEHNFLKAQKVLTHSQHSVNMNIFNDLENFAPAFINSLPLMKNIEELSIPDIKGFDTFALLAHLFEEKNYLKKLSVSGQHRDNFDTFVRSIYLNKNHTLVALDFQNTKLTISDIDTLAECVLNSNINSLGFHNAVRKDSIGYIFTSFLRTDICNNLYSLNLDRTIGLNLSVLFQAARNLHSLSLAQCDLEISTVFEEIAKNNILKLCFFNISGNLCFKEIDQSLSFPPFLNTIKADDISWNDNCFTSFLRFVFNNLSLNVNHQFCQYSQINDNLNIETVNLSLARAVATKEEFIKVFDLFYEYTNQCEIHFGSLNWDGNPLSEKLFEMLIQSNNLSSLSLNECFSYKRDNKDTIEQNVILLSNLISNSQTLKFLSLRGNKNNYLGNKIGPILDACIGHHSLEILDISYSKSGTEFLSKIHSLVKDVTPLKILAFDKLFPEDGKKYKDFLSDIRFTQTITKVSFPIADLKYLKENNQIDQKTFDQFTKLFCIIDKSKISRHSYFDKPSQLFRYFPHDVFPFPDYFEKSDIKNLKIINFNIPMRKSTQIQNMNIISHHISISQTHTLPYNTIPSDFQTNTLQNLSTQNSSSFIHSTNLSSNDIVHSTNVLNSNVRSNFQNTPKSLKGSTTLYNNLENDGIKLRSVEIGKPEKTLRNNQKSESPRAPKSPIQTKYLSQRNLNIEDDLKMLAVYSPRKQADTQVIRGNSNQTKIKPNLFKSVNQRRTPMNSKILDLEQKERMTQLLNEFETHDISFPNFDNNEYHTNAFDKFNKELSIDKLFAQIKK
ncbi:hypothetical protein TRFO_37963 [Tritrichomonas foetus]|uniref:Leucine Rich Repeat family protein n=1 Tax=Tritrichomonas foetus TaxID=1144522 RepID=A0A1J4JER4_9EUKA|nr:hypothetical protein TRFO_37963 [Tritrichomonas foetus]|eukprot:OHS95933.1 hypothetical protein TRFO_37963 [Tritrichomonas foetus]